MNMRMKKMKHNIIVRQYLIKNGLRQCDLAKICKVHEATISKWLNRQELPEKKQLELISLIQKAGEQHEQ